MGNDVRITMSNVFAGSDATIRKVGETEVAVAWVCKNYPTAESVKSGSFEDARPEWFELEFWGKMATVAADRIKKGSKISFSADSHKLRKYQREDETWGATLSYRVVPMSWTAEAPKGAEVTDKDQTIAVLQDQLRKMQTVLSGLVDTKLQTMKQEATINGSPFIEPPHDDEDIPF
jgi:single-stranded DNA-binding protein